MALCARGELTVKNWGARNLFWPSLKTFRSGTAKPACPRESVAEDDGYDAATRTITRIRKGQRDLDPDGDGVGHGNQVYDHPRSQDERLLISPSELSRQYMPCCHGANAHNAWDA